MFHNTWRRKDNLEWRRNQGNLAFNLAPGSKLVLRLCENLHGNMGIVVGARAYPNIQVLTSA